MSKAAMTRKLNAERKARLEMLQVQARATVATGRCPDCGAGIRRNMSMTGWYQCEQYGADGFRKDSNKPACAWQAFTE